MSYPAAWGKPTSEVRYNTTVITLTDGFSIVVGLLPGQNDTPTTYQSMYSYYKSPAALADGDITSDITIGGRPAFTTAAKSHVTGQIVQIYGYTHYSTTYNNFENIFEVTYTQSPTRNLTQTDIDLFNKVVSTITFTK